MRRVDLSPREFAFIVATRAALGVGIGLLTAGRIRRSARRRLGLSLVAAGALTTIPAAWLLLGRRAGREADPRSASVA